MRHLAAFVLALLALVPITWIVAIHDRLASNAWTKPLQPAHRRSLHPSMNARRPAPAPKPQAGRPDPLLDEDASDEVLAAAPSASEATIFSKFASSDAFVSYHPLLDRALSDAEKTQEMAPELTDAMGRIEGMYDPTRVGALGPALRMQIRPGTVSMTNVFGDRWLRADVDPNVHYKVHTFAEVWLHPLPRGCDGFTRFRPNDGVLLLDAMGPGDCARIARLRKRDPYAVVYQAVSSAPMSLPLFAAPYAGGRFTLPELRAIQDARRAAAEQRLWFKRRATMPVFFRRDPVTGRPTRIPSPTPPP